MCAAPRKDRSTWCSKLGRKNPLRVRAVVRAEGTRSSRPPHRRSASAAPGNRDLVLPRILGCVVAGMGICMVPHMALKTFPDAKLLSIHAVNNRFDGDHDVPDF